MSQKVDAGTREFSSTQDSGAHASLISLNFGRASSVCTFVLLPVRFFGSLQLSALWGPALTISKFLRAHETLPIYLHSRYPGAGGTSNPRSKGRETLGDNGGPRRRIRRPQPLHKTARTLQQTGYLAEPAMALFPLSSSTLNLWSAYRRSDRLFRCNIMLLSLA